MSSLSLLHRGQHRYLPPTLHTITILEDFKKMHALLIVHQLFNTGVILKRYSISIKKNV